ncbi:hypothetical protein ABT299_50570 [Spirillospora sp. NPDC000708]
MPREQLPQRHVVAARHGRDQLVVVHHPLYCDTRASGSLASGLSRCGRRVCPVYVTQSTFEDGTCSNGGALSSIGASWTILTSLFTGNRAIGWGANSARGGMAGGGSGGAVYADGNRFAIRIAGTVIHGNRANEGGGAVFFVSNDDTGELTIDHSRLTGNRNAGFETAGLPVICFHSTGRAPITASTLNR